MVRPVDSIKAIGNGLKHKKNGVWESTGGPGDAVAALPGIVHRLKATDLALADGGAVAAWGDLVQANAARRPVFMAEGGIDGGPVVRFANYSFLTGPFARPNYIDWFVMAVLKRNATGVRQGVALLGPMAQGTWATFEASGNISVRQSGNHIAWTGDLDDQQPHVFGWGGWHTSPEDLSGGASRTYTDDPNEDANLGGLGGNGYDAFWDTMILGSRGADADNLVADVAEIIICNEFPTLEQRTAAFAALAAEYSIS